jgi:hypothetical protein
MQEQQEIERYSAKIQRKAEVIVGSANKIYGEFKKKKVRSFGRG